MLPAGWQQQAAEPQQPAEPAGIQWRKVGTNHKPQSTSAHANLFPRRLQGLTNLHAKAPLGAKARHITTAQLVSPCVPMTRVQSKGVELELVLCNELQEVRMCCTAGAAARASCHQHHHCQCSWALTRARGGGEGFQTHQSSRLLALLLGQAPYIKQSSSLAVLSPLASKYFPTLLWHALHLF